MLYNILVEEVVVIKFRYIKFPVWIQTLLYILFPIYLVMACEFGHLQNFGSLSALIRQNTGIFIFDVLLLGGLFSVLTLVVKKVWISGTICFAVFYLFSCIEYYKYSVSGSHFVITDLALTKNVTDVAAFANLSFNVTLFVIAVVSIVYLAVLFISDSGICVKRSIRYAASMGIFLMVFAGLVSSYFHVVARAAEINSEYTKNTFQENRRFSNNYLIANLAVNINQVFNSGPVRPDDYSENAIDAIIQQMQGVLGPETSDKPNVVVIMSESFADFRHLLDKYPDSGETIPDGTYDAFDEVLSESTSGICVVPTFGGGTVRTEFELMFGLPMESQGNPASPLSLFKKGEEYKSIPSLYSENGYSTSFIHPFSKSFYERNDYYRNFGFDQLMFDEDMSVYLSDELLNLDRAEGTQTYGYYHNFISDRSAMEEVIWRMKETDTRDYIHVTTMQNHMPYGEGRQEEFNYFEGIKISGEDLRWLTDQLKSFDEPTIVLFVGDHYPFFSDPGSVYGRLGINELNCDLLYEQHYLIWNNYDFEVSNQPKISSFYLPCILAEYSGVGDSFVRAVISQKELCPIYSPVIASEGTDILKILTYDRVNGKNYAEQ